MIFYKVINAAIEGARINEWYIIIAPEHGRPNP